MAENGFYILNISTQWENCYRRLWTFFFFKASVTVAVNLQPFDDTQSVAVPGGSSHLVLEFWPKGFPYEGYYFERVTGPATESSLTRALMKWLAFIIRTVGTDYSRFQVSLLYFPLSLSPLFSLSSNDLERRDGGLPGAPPNGLWPPLRHTHTDNSIYWHSKNIYSLHQPVNLLVHIGFPSCCPESWVVGIQKGEQVL